MFRAITQAAPAEAVRSPCEEQTSLVGPRIELALDHGVVDADGQAALVGDGVDRYELVAVSHLGLADKAVVGEALQAATHSVVVHVTIDLALQPGDQVTEARRPLGDKAEQGRVVAETEKIKNL